MTSPIDRAFVEIEPDTRDFSRTLNRDIEKAYDKVEAQTEVVSKKITKSFDAAGREIERTFETVARDGKVQTKIIEQSFDAAGDKIQRVFRLTAAEGVEAEELIATVAKVAADSVGDSWERAGERIEDAFRDAAIMAKIRQKQIEHSANEANDSVGRSVLSLNRLFSNLGQTIVSLGSALVGLGAAAPTPAGLVAILATITAIAALIGPIIALTAALSQLVGLVGPLPAALGVLVAAILPLVFAFQGLGDAIKAVNDGDPEKIAEAMKKLSPAARSVVREIVGLNKAFSDFRKIVQQGFFAPIIGDIKATGQTLLPQLAKSVAEVAESFGRATSNLLEFLREPATVKILNQLFLTTASIIDDIATGFTDVFKSFFPLIQAGLPFIKRFSDAFGGLLTDFANFLTESTKTGAFQSFVEDGIRTFKELLDLIKAVGNLLGALFGGFADEGEDFIQTLTRGTNALADFFRSAEGQRTLQDFVDSIHGTVFVIGLLAKGIQLAIEGFHFMADMWSFVGRQLSAGAQSVGKFFADLWTRIVNGAQAVGDFFRALPGRILAFIQSIPGLVLDLFNFLFDELNRRIGIGIGLIIFTFTELPKKVFTAIQALPELLGDLFSAAWRFAQDKTVQGITAVINFVKSLPGRIGALASSVGAAVANFFSRIFSGGKTQASNAVDAIIGFIKKLPSRLTSFVSDVGGRIGDAIKRVLNRAIDKINSGIADVDRFLPGDLPRIPNLAQGAIVKAKPGGTIARIAEAGQDEIVGPLKDVAKLFEGAGDTTITFGPGSVQVTFEGAVPTAEQARQTGNAVGLGIIDVLKKRNIRTTVRAI